MAKEKQIPLTLEEEMAEKEQFAGMLKAEILKTASDIGRAKEKSAKISGDLSADLQNFEDKGGNKKALKWAKYLADLEPAAAQDFWRCLDGYANALGVFEQIDMFNDAAANAANAYSIEKASEPSFGAEPIH